MLPQGIVASFLISTLGWTIAAHPTWSKVPAKTYAKCQRPAKHHPLDDCPKHTLYVSKDAAVANFTTIQDAILSLPNNTDAYTILIAPGDYNEQLNVTRQGPLTLLGVSDRPWKGKSYSNIDYDTSSSNRVTVSWAMANHDSSGKIVDNAVTSVLTVAPTWESSKSGFGPTGWPVPDGTPFGCEDFRAYNIDFRNYAADAADGPAHAAGISRANAGFYSCGLYSYQDTLFIGKLGNAFFYDSIIAGQTDFLYGYGTMWVEKSTLSLRNCGGGITAWKGTNTTFENKYGAYISKSQILADNATIAADIKNLCPLGRPWNELHRSIFMNTYFDASILPAGYIDWNGGRFNNQTFMATYSDFGPGWDPEAEKNSNRTIVLDRKGVSGYDTPAKVFANEDGKLGKIGWIDHTVVSKN
ncbi:pectin methylesterase family protein [Ilyonectria robusta]|uniref:pectin methylesterase family protein n=1 Tax=Ilyonectria robusta TaxID=1079257 RepID=UPI001E8DBB9E|nr:pectin methylesterase family protein [Ilyonectria robusta]KAH8663274.1 pectin methylesterase family protein [Ilyonectria robusta]